MGAKTMLYLVGGDVKNNIFPDHIDQRIADALLFCLYHDLDRRPQNAQVYFKTFVTMLERNFGKPQFHHFNMPTPLKSA
jgi:hypothetical protein